MHRHTPHETLRAGQVAKIRLLLLARQADVQILISYGTSDHHHLSSNINNVILIRIYFGVIKLSFGLHIARQRGSASILHP